MQAQGIIWGWLGVSDLAIEGEFVYASDGLPYFGNVGNVGGVEHCVMLHSYEYDGITNYLGNDANCGSVGNPICQYEITEVQGCHGDGTLDDQPPICGKKKHSCSTLNNFKRPKEAPRASIYFFV
jgi:hypothetical protein